ncbi:MAG: hypothetical protein QM711_04830 [Micropruina sp.]|uniref:hypothetical protein n=1 Tax=Micropruina sp. TaxID=2737536 RepID=UPI0039E5151A
MVYQICPQHAQDEVDGIWVSSDVGTKFTCPRPDHIEQGPFTWFGSPPQPPGTDLSGIAADLGLAVEIPAVLKQFSGQWVEYGVFEHGYASTHAKEWAFLMDRYGHTAVAAKRYTASAFLAATLGNLERRGVVTCHAGPATGRWAYNSTISYWALPQAPDWTSRLSWADSGLTVAYVPGQTEV